MLDVWRERKMRVMVFQKDYEMPSMFRTWIYFEKGEGKWTGQQYSEGAR